MSSDSESPKRNQVRRVIVGHEFATDLFSEGVRVVNGLPDDAELVRMHDCPSRMTYEFVFRSRKFSPVSEGDEIPEYQITFEEIPTFSTC